MNIPNLPTDNLYKFMAIFGLIMLLSSFYYLLNTVFANSKLSEILEIKTEINSDKLADLQNQVAELKKNELRDGRIYEEIREDLFLKREYLSKEFEKSRIELAEIKSNLNTSAIVLASLLALAGSFLVEKGFKLWYNRYQIYVDAETKYNGEKFIQLLKEQEQVKDNSSD